MTVPSVEDWRSSLDSLEEWVRRLAGATTYEPAPELPTGRVPDSLRLRALVLNAQMLQTVADGRVVLQQLAQQQAYAQV